jgi:hypothetical protein
MSERTQVLGLCRFSYPANLEAFQTRHPDMQSRRAALYDAARLGVRFFLFEHFLLPAIKAQTDPDFTLLVLMGDDFPEPWRTRMLDLIAGTPQIRPVFHESANHREVYRKILLAARDPAARLVAEFRLDDDDAVAVDFVEQLRTWGPGLTYLMSLQGRVALDFRRGLVVQTKGTQIDYSPVTAAFWAPALAMFQWPDAPRCVMDLAHSKLWQHMPTMGLVDQPMFLRGLHGSNDSAIELRAAGTYALPKNGAGAILRDRFAVDAGRVARDWRKIAPTIAP